MKDVVVTVKVDQDLYEKLKDLPDRSKFIRNAIESALEDRCPLCNGTGIMNKSQKKHWDEFIKTHSVERCTECGSLYIKCFNKKE
ncbi:MAG: NADP-dependent isocitrate dehydrogenase [Spirochaetales bacterium]|jgi:uncharacterized protein with PIN domain|nr:CopG family transcriptional regulator [Exilispira sp.]NMC67105.1 NADP-dependent isocitrate dehydrogenase [Spirochaetales bacterium]